MSSEFSDPPRVDGETSASVEYLLFDSLVHHLIEKGLLAKNDALSVVQTVAEILRGQRDEGVAVNNRIDTALSVLERTYGSFQALPDRYGRPGLDADNVRPLRTPLHGNRPEFPKDD